VDAGHHQAVHAGRSARGAVRRRHQGHDRVTEVKGFERQHGHTELYRGAEFAVDFLPELKIELAVGHEQHDQATEEVIGAARTGKIGDGKILVEGREQAIGIRTQETGADAR
jgi:nitrogen regulatory protein P-II 2